MLSAGVIGVCRCAWWGCCFKSGGGMRCVHYPEEGGRSPAVVMQSRLLCLGGALPGWDHLKSAASQSQNQEPPLATQWSAKACYTTPHHTPPHPCPHPLGWAAPCLCFAVLDLGLAGVALGWAWPCYLSLWVRILHRLVELSSQNQQGALCQGSCPCP